MTLLRAGPNQTFPSPARAQASIQAPNIICFRKSQPARVQLSDSIEVAVLRWLCVRPATRPDLFSTNRSHLVELRLCSTTIGQNGSRIVALFQVSTACGQCAVPKQTRQDRSGSRPQLSAGARNQKRVRPPRRSGIRWRSARSIIWPAGGAPLCVAPRHPCPAYRSCDPVRRGGGIHVVNEDGVRPEWSSRHLCRPGRLVGRRAICRSNL